MMHLRFAISDSPSSGTPGEGRGGGRLSIRTAFTFLEVLFAVIVLGVGFIMVAAMFPAALKQTQSTMEDTASSALWSAFARKMQSMGRDYLPPIPAPLPPAPAYALDTYLRAPSATPPATGQPAKVYSFNDSRVGTSPANYDKLWDYVAANFIVDTDARYAVVPMFMRGSDKNAAGTSAWSSQVQLFLVTVRSRNKSQYDLRDIRIGKQGSSLVMANLQPALVSVQVYPPPANSVEPPRINFKTLYDRDRTFKPGLKKPSVLSTADEDTPMGPGAYVIISDSPPSPTGRSRNGQVYRLGTRVDPADATTYYIAPDVQGASDAFDGSLPSGGYVADAFVVGRGVNPNTGGTLYDGPVQDMGIGIVPISLNIQQTP